MPAAAPTVDVERYRSRVSGPLLDRIDIHLEVPAVPYPDLVGAACRGVQRGGSRSGWSAPGSVQRERFRERAGRPRQRPHDHPRPAPLLRPRAGRRALLRQAVHRLGLSARAYHRVLKIARTIADLDGADSLDTGHVSEAIQYRSLDRTKVAA